MTNLLLLLLACQNSLGYEPLKDQVWNACQEDVITLNGLPLKYKYCYTENLKLEIANEIRTATDLIFRVAKQNHLNLSGCAYNYQLEIYNVDLKTLNHLDFKDEDKKIPGKILGLYDPRTDEVVVSSIIISDHGYQENKLTLAHELAHYWYDRSCWSQDWSGDSESFAEKVEETYKLENGE